MDPLTDRTTEIVVDGRTIKVHQPGALATGATRNWRLTEEAYRRYEQHIREGIRNWPNETKFAVPSGMSPNTFEHRFRDALQALREFKYDADVALALAALPGNPAVSMDPDGKHVWFRERSKRGRPISLSPSSHERPGTILRPTIYGTPTLAALRAFQTLISEGHLVAPLSFRGVIDEAVQSAIVADYDTAFVYDAATDITQML